MPSRETWDRIGSALALVGAALIIIIVAGLVLGCESAQIEDSTFDLTRPLDSLFVSDEPEPQPPDWIEGPGIFVGRHIARYQNATIYTDFYIVTQQSLAVKPPPADLAGGVE